jgi:hypothetical protein
MAFINLFKIISFWYSAKIDGIWNEWSKQQNDTWRMIVSEKSIIDER